MKRSRFTENQIVQILKGQRRACPWPTCAAHGSARAVYKWEAKYGGMEASDVRRLRELEEENRRLKAMYAELSLEHRVLKEVVEKKP